MKRLTTLTFHYYQLLLLYNIAFTLCGAFIFASEAHGFRVAIFMPAKLVGFAAAAALHYFSSKQTYFYFRNAGYHIGRVIISAFVLDISIYFILMTLVVCLF
ncbi:MAG: hypothetical protein EOP47_14640 [Sphingobacteriaceae bacterium]|nr:MAG: hypothetical protein EOP47_14640 [Sphingobacteriaceae bacterium]